MLNHARTVLLNTPPPMQLGYPGEELIPKEFVPKVVTGLLKSIQDILIGTDPDRLFANYRVQQILALLHSSGLDMYVRGLDPRITYLPFRQDWSGVFGVQAVPLNRERNDANIAFIGLPPADEVAGILENQWAIRVTDAATVQVLRRTPSELNTYTVDVLQGLSADIPLTKDLVAKLQLQYDGGDVVLYDDLSSIVGQGWLVTGRAKPTLALASLEPPLKELVHGLQELELFGANPVEPYKTFLDMWRNSLHFPTRIGGLFLAFIYRLSEHDLSPKAVVLDKRKPALDSGSNIWSQFIANFWLTFTLNDWLTFKL